MQLWNIKVPSFLYVFLDKFRTSSSSVGTLNRTCCTGSYWLLYFNPFCPQGWQASNFSLQYHPWITHYGHKNWKFKKKIVENMHTHLMLGCKELKNTSVWAIPEEQFYNFCYIIGGNLFLKKSILSFLYQRTAVLNLAFDTFYMLEVRRNYFSSRILTVFYV